MANGPDAGRRSFLSFCTDLLLLALALLLAIPAFAYFLSPLWARRRRGSTEGGFVDAGPLAALPVGEWRLLTLEILNQDGWRQSLVRHAAWARRTGKADSEVVVLSPICPHLGCPIDWNPSKGQFNCPCHGGTFDRAGRRIGGPPPRSMDDLEHKVRAGRLWVRWQDFKIGVAERLPVTT
jgi:menaquinol-cytochrome c reductase iron-sulfur subunit